MTAQLRPGATVQFGADQVGDTVPAPVPQMTVEEASQALDRAKVAHVEARDAVATSSAEAARLRGEVKAGRGGNVSPADIAAADQALEHSTLLLQGTEEALDPLQAALAAAQTEALCDEIVTEIVTLGTDLERTLEVLSSDLPALEAAASSYDTFAANARQKLSLHAMDSPRVKAGRHDSPSVDRIPLASAKAWAHVAVLLVPTMRSLGAPTFFVDQLKAAAASAPTIPTT
jgi:hypothetical protein